MARYRTIKPEFWTSEQVMECSTIARLMFIGMWNFCDDAGRMVDSVKQIKALVFPSDDLDGESIRRMIDELSSNKLIVRYVVGDKGFIQVTGWHHQKIDRPQPSKIPPPGNVEPSPSPNDRRLIAPEGNRIEKSREDTPSLRSGGAPAGASEPAEKSKKAEVRAGRLPADWSLPAEWRKWTIAEGMAVAEVDRQAVRFRDFWIAKGGKDAAKLDWEATWRNWIRRAFDDRPALRLVAPVDADPSATLPLPIDSPAYKPLLSKYRFEHGGKDPPTNGKTADFPAAWVKRATENEGAFRQ